jgi:hypothetical protein
MARGDDADRDQDGVYGLELVPEAGDESEPPAGREPRAERRETSRGTSQETKRETNQETIGSDRARQFPRTLRIVGLLAIAVALTITLWPTAGSKPAPAPVQIRVAGTALTPSGRITTLTLVLANDAQSSASVGRAEIQDADGRHIGSDRLWPAGDIPAGSTLAVDIPVPYACDTHIPQRLPIALHVSVSSPLDPGAAKDLAYPLDAQTWQRFEHYQSGICDSGDSAAVKIGAISVVGTDPATHSVQILTPVSVAEPLTVDGIFAAYQAFRVTADPEPPLTLPASGWQPITTTWQVRDCRTMADQGTKKQVLLLAYEGPTGGTSVAISLPENVVAQLAATACPH